MEHSNLQKSEKGNLASRSLEFTQFKLDKYILTALFIRVTVYSLNPSLCSNFAQSPWPSSSGRKQSSSPALAFPAAVVLAGGKGWVEEHQGTTANLRGCFTWPELGQGGLATAAASSGTPRPWRRPRTTGSAAARLRGGGGRPHERGARHGEAEGQQHL